MAAKVFEVGDVLPATTQLRISWVVIGSNIDVSIETDFPFIIASLHNDFYDIIRINSISVYEGSSWINPYTDQYGNHNYMVIDVSSWSELKRTISYAVYGNGDNYCNFYWEDLAPVYSITFEENGGSTVTDLTEQPNLPNPLPTTTKANHVFAGWYYDNLFTQKAIAGDELTTNVTLYAKWEPKTYTITIDGTGYSVGDGDSLLVNSTGLYNSTTSTQVYAFTPTTGRFRGFNTSSGQTIPSSNYEIGDTFTATQNLTLYSVEQLPTVTYDLDNLNLDVGTHTITAKAKASGFADSVASNSKTYLVSNVAPIYGVSGLYDSSVALTRTDDAVGKTFAINSSSGAITSDFNDLFPWNETTIETISGNKFVKFPEMWFRVGKDSSNRITDVAVSKQQGPTGNWYKVDGFYYSCYGGSLSNSKLASVSGATRLHTQTRATFRNYATANGSGYFQEDLYHRTVLTFLWWIEWATKKSDTIMSGRISGSGTSGGSSMRPTGGTDSVATPSGYETSYAQMRYHYIEDFVGNLLEFVDGSVGTGSSGGVQYVTANPANFGDTSANHNSLVFNSPTTSGNCNAAYGWDDANPFLCLPKETVNNSSYNTYFCDYASTSNNIVLCCGAYWSADYAYYGVSYFDRNAVSYSIATIGGRLLYKP